VTFRWELLTRAIRGTCHSSIDLPYCADCFISYHIGMYIFMWANSLDQQQCTQLEANYIYDGTFPVSSISRTWKIFGFLSLNLYRLSSQHHKYPNAVTSLANTIYNSIPKIYIDSLQLCNGKGPNTVRDEVNGCTHK
jgi:hypothetical protein